MFHRSRARQVAFGRQVLCCLLLSLLASSPAWAFDPLAGDFSKEHPLDVRIVEYNHERNFISDPSRDAAFNRILIALNPDVICFEEFESSVSSTAIRDRLDSILPIDGGGNWQIHLGLLGGIRTVIASRYPLTMKRVDTIPASSTRGVTIALVDLPESNYDRDIYLLGVHLKCCGSPGSSEDDSRQDSADAIANWLGDARGVSRPFGDNVELPADTPMISLGDFNLVGGPQPEDTLLTGDIQSESTYGPDVKGDWDISDMTDLHPVDPFTGDDFTWQGSSSYAPSRLDRFFYTDSVVTIANSFILNSDTMTSSALAAAGLQSSDTLPSRSADHLPMVADLRLVTVGECTIDADCDDGEFCNGAEYCNASQICRPGIEPCTEQLCRETDDICVDCLADADCADDLFCNGVEMCDASGSCQPGDDPCPGEMCDEPTAQCVECFVDADCDDGNPCTGEERCTAAGFCEDGACHETVTVVDADFNIDAGDFVYVDDVFGTSNASKADGSHELAGGFDGGGLRIFLGPGSASGALSGGWSRDFTLPESSTVTVSLRYRLLLGAGYETSEYGEAVLEIDGTRYGADANDALAHLTGDGNGGVTSTPIPAGSWNPSRSR